MTGPSTASPAVKCIYGNSFIEGMFGANGRTCNQSRLRVTLDEQSNAVSAEQFKDSTTGHLLGWGTRARRIIIRRRTFIKRHESRNIHSDALCMCMYTCVIEL